MSLLPCPFCGAPATQASRDEYPYGNAYWVECSEPDCGVMVPDQPHRWTADAMWNRRTPAPAPKTESER